MGLAIRDARVGDAEAIAALLGQLGYPSAAEAIPARLERLRIVGDRVVVATVDGDLAGLAHLQVSPTIQHERPAGNIRALVVDESHRRAGVGRALVEEMETEARRRGCFLIFLTTAARREEAHDFYRRVGLEETGKRFGKYLD